MAKRIPQVNELIQRELSQIVLREIEFPLDVLVTITRVAASQDLEYAKIYISVIPEQKSKDKWCRGNQFLHYLQATEPPPPLPLRLQLPCHAVLPRSPV